MPGVSHGELRCAASRVVVMMGSLLAVICALSACEHRACAQSHFAFVRFDFAQVDFQFDVWDLRDRSSHSRHRRANCANEIDAYIIYANEQLLHFIFGSVAALEMWAHHFGAPCFSGKRACSLFFLFEFLLRWTAGFVSAFVLHFGRLQQRRRRQRQHNAGVDFIIIIFRTNKCCFASFWTVFVFGRERLVDATSRMAPINSQRCAHGTWLQCAVDVGKHKYQCCFSENK